MPKGSGTAGTWKPTYAPNVISSVPAAMSPMCRIRALIRSLTRMGTRKSPSVRPRSSCGMRSMRADADTGPMLPDEPDGGGQHPEREGVAAEELAVRLEVDGAPSVGGRDLQPGRPTELDARRAEVVAAADPPGEGEQLVARRGIHEDRVEEAVAGIGAGKRAVRCATNGLKPTPAPLMKRRTARSPLSGSAASSTGGSGAGRPATRWLGR